MNDRNVITGFGGFFLFASVRRGFFFVIWFLVFDNKVNVPVAAWQWHTMPHSVAVAVSHHRTQWQSQQVAVAAWQQVAVAASGNGSGSGSGTQWLWYWQWQWQLGSAPPVAVAGGSYLSVSILRGRATPASVSVTQG
jgi:hypothetical protein